jgi:hypothetical protein
MEFETTTGPHDQMPLNQMPLNQMPLTPLLQKPPLLCPSLELWLVRSRISDGGPTLDQGFTDPDLLPPPPTRMTRGESPAFELPAGENAWPEDDDAWLCSMMCAGGEDPEPQQRAQGAGRRDPAELRRIEGYVAGLADVPKKTRTGEVYELRREDTKNMLRKYRGEALRMAIDFGFICMRLIRSCGRVGDREEFCQCVGGKNTQGGGAQGTPHRARGCRNGKRPGELMLESKRRVPGGLGSFEEPALGMHDEPGLGSFAEPAAGGLGMHVSVDGVDLDFVDACVLEEV